MKLATAFMLLLLASTAVRAEKCPLVGANVLQPIWATHTLPPWPAVIDDRPQLRSEVRLLVDVGGDGKPRNVDLISSSGKRYLDDAAIDWIKSRWRWKRWPGRCASTRVTVIFTLKEFVARKEIATPAPSHMLDRALLRRANRTKQEPHHHLTH